MVKVSATFLIFYMTSSWSTIETQPPSWLDRLVFHYKKIFLTEVSKLPAVPFQATIEKAPSGYVDSKAWDFDSVMRLLMLIQSSDNKPLQRTIHEVLKPTRRIFIEPGRNKFKLFPSLAKDHVDNFYYDGVDSAEYWASDEVNVFNASDISAIILVTNPVESRLPSARISVDLLRDIMMTRALAAREMPAQKTKEPAKRNTTTGGGGKAKNKTLEASASNNTGSAANNTNTPDTSNNSTKPNGTKANASDNSTASKSTDTNGVNNATATNSTDTKAVDKVTATTSTDTNGVNNATATNSTDTTAVDNVTATTSTGTNGLNDTDTISSTTSTTLAS